MHYRRFLWTNMPKSIWICQHMFSLVTFIYCCNFECKKRKKTLIFIECLLLYSTFNFHFNQTSISPDNYWHIEPDNMHGGGTVSIKLILVHIYIDLNLFDTTCNFLYLFSEKIRSLHIPIQIFFPNVDCSSSL